MTGGSSIIAELRAIQRAHGFIPVTALRDLSERARVPLYQLHGVVSFFPHFRESPAPPAEHATPDGRALRVDPYAEAGQRYGAARKLATDGDAAGVIAALKASNLRGMGGAGFPTGLKWEIVRNAEGSEKYIVCNGDESEPGTFKDRHILENAPHLLVEGMVLAGLVTGPRQGMVYIRHEHAPRTETV